MSLVENARPAMCENAGETLEIDRTTASASATIDSAPPAADATPSRWAFRSRDFRLLMLGNLISWVGDWMDLVALNWAVLALSGSALQLALINACRLVPVFALSVPAGVLADRFDRRRLLLWMQAGAMLLTFVVGALVTIRSAFLPFAIVVTARACLAAMALPIRSALLPSLVSPQALASAVASQTALMGLSRIVGPALCGALLLVAPIEMVFWINGASFAAVLWTLWTVRTGAAPERSPAPIRADLREALIYIRGDGALRSLLVLAIVPMTFGFPYTSMMPLFARDFLNCGPAGLGALLAAAAAGAMTGSAVLAMPGCAERAGRTMIVATLLFGAGLLAFTASRSLPLALATMFLTGLAGQAYRTASRITLQSRTPDRLRGRILSIALMDRGFIPLGAVMLGAAADFAGATAAGVLMGAGCLLATLIVVATRREVWSL